MADSAGEGPASHGTEPLALFPERKAPRLVAFDRRELQIIMNVYGRMVAAGEWRDYAMDFAADRAEFAIFRRSSEMPLYRIVKDPELRQRQGQYQVLAPGGLILKRGHDLQQVITVLEKRPKLALA